MHTVNDERKGKRITKSYKNAFWAVENLPGKQTYQIRTVENRNDDIKYSENGC